MRRIIALLFAACLLSLQGCNVVRDAVFGGLAEKYDTSHHPDERRAAYDNYISEYVDQ